MKVTPIDAYKTYISLKNHFTQTNYDFLKYNGKVKASEKSFYKRKDRFWFEKLSRQKDDDEIISFFVANFSLSDNPDKLWIGELIKSGNDNFLKWQKKIQSLSYNFKEEIESIFLDKEFDSFFALKNRSHPKILKLYLSKEISLETLIILDSILGYKKSFDRNIDDPIWNSVSMKMEKYSPFLNIDIVKYKNMLKTVVLNK